MRHSRTISAAIIATALLSASCREEVTGGRTTVPVVEDILSGELAHEASVLGRFDPKDPRGSIAVVGNESLAFPLALRFITSDDFDNVDGRRDPDLLPDFAGETIDLVMYRADTDYHSLIASYGADSLRAVTVRDLISVLDDECLQGLYDEETMVKGRSKAVVFPSPYMALYGCFDVDTLMRASGAVVPVVFPARKAFEDILDGADGQVRVAVITDSLTAMDGIHAKLFAEMAAERGMHGSECQAFVRDTVGDVLANLLSAYRAMGGMLPLSAVLIDDAIVDAHTVRASMQRINEENNVDNMSMRKLMTGDCRVMDTFEISTDECYRALRRNNLFTHDVAYPVYRGFVTVASPDGKAYELVGTQGNVSDKR